MYIKHTIGQQKTLQELNDYFDYARNWEVRKKWLQANQLNLKYYYGDQWSEAHRKELEDLNAIAFTNNRIEPAITTYISLQIKARRRVAFKPTTGMPEHAIVAENVNNLIYSVQNQNDAQNKSTQKFKDTLIGGLGFTHFGYDPDCPQPFFYDYVNPAEVYLDPDDQSQRFSESNFICRSYFLSTTRLKERYPKYAAYFDDLIGKDTNKINSPPNWNYSGDDESNLWTKGRSIRIVEVYYKKNAKYYESTISFDSKEPLDEDGVTSLDQYFYTFDKDLAKAKAEKGSEVKTRDGTQIWKGVFCCDVLLESGPLYPQVPNQQHFPIIPLCLQRNYEGVPYGVVDDLISPSIAHNYIWSKALHGLGAKHLIISDNNTDIPKMREILTTELRQKLGIIFTKNPQDAQLIIGESLLPQLFDALKRVDIEFELKTGLFDELRGNETNAISGVAIQQRAINSANSQTPMHATYEQMLISEGKLMLDTIKGITDLKYAFNYYKDGKLNFASLDSEIATINFEIFPDIAPNFSTLNEEQIVRFENLLNSNTAPLVMSDPVLMQNLNFSKEKSLELNEAYFRAVRSQQELAQGQQPGEDQQPQAPQPQQV